MNQSVTAAPTAPKAPTSFDTQRTQIQSEEARRQKNQQEAMQRRLSTSGFQQGSGIAELQSRRLQNDMGIQEQTRLSGVDVAQRAAEEAQRNALELQANVQGLTREQMAMTQGQFETNVEFEARKQAAAERQFGQQFGLESAAQSIGAQQFGQTLGLQTRAQTAEEEQYAASQELKVWQAAVSKQQEEDKLAMTATLAANEDALRVELQGMQNTAAYQALASREGIEAANRAMTQQLQTQKITDEQIARTQQYGFAYKELRQSTYEFGRQMSLSEAEAMLAADQFADNMLWQESQFDQNLEFESDKFYADQDQQRDMAELNNTLALNTLNLQDTINDENETRKLMLDNMFSRGVSGELMDTSKMSPDQANAYQAGLSGKNKQDYDREVATQNELLNSMVINAATPAVVQRVADIYASFGYYPGVY